MPISDTFLSPLGSQPVVTTAAAIVMGDVNSYDATSGALAPPLPPLSGQTVGAMTAAEKYVGDVSTNAVTVTCAGADTFHGGATTLILPGPGTLRLLQVVEVSAIRYWKVVGGFDNVSTASVFAATKRRVVANATSPSSVTINADLCEVYKLTALANALSLAVTGTFYDEQPLKVTILDNGTQRALSWSSSFGNLGVVGLPAFTTPGKKITMQFFYDAVYARFILAAVDTVGYVY